MSQSVSCLWHWPRGGLKEVCRLVTLQRVNRVFPFFTTPPPPPPPPPPAIVHDIIIAGEENALVSLYGGIVGENLVACSTDATVRNWRSTVLKYSLGICLQISSDQASRSKSVLASKVMEREGQRHVIGGLGWNVKEGQVLPRMTDQPAGPVSLLRMIKC